MTTPDERCWLVRVLDSDILTRAMKLAVLSSLVSVLWLNHQQHQLTQCQADYADASAKSSTQRAAAAAEDREALDDMVRAVASATTPAEPKRALDEYVAARAAADKRRAENPLPEPPSTFCK